MLRIFGFFAFLLFSSLSIGQDDWTMQQRMDSIKLWISELEADSTVDTEIIGTGQLSPQYDRYEKLTLVASDSQFFDLTEHRSPIVRLYAYYGLTHNNPTMLVEALRNHPDDTAKVICRNGALVKESRVYDEALSWAEEFLVRGNPRGLSRADKEFVHHQYMLLMMNRRERSKQEKTQKKGEE